ncbi:MAG TPA: protein kinase [Opitutaceae bacterium]|nr:protein kinase [Opitutaceae bacterium]
MRLTYAQASTAGPVRPVNEDCAAIWHPAEEDVAKSVGIAAILADGVGGESRGDVASRLAVAAIQETLAAAALQTAAGKILRGAFDAASRVVFEPNLARPEAGRMATTLTLALFRENSVYVANVGDSRAYHVRAGRIRLLTTDHSYVAPSVKLRLTHAHHAMTDPKRSVLTRSIGTDPITKFDLSRTELAKGDVIVQCTDGVYGFVVDDEIRDLASHHAPEEACRRLIALAERRQTDDNLSVQVIRVDELDLIAYFHGVPIFKNYSPLPVSNELEPGQVLDDRFEITELISRSGMASIFKARDRENGRTVAIKVPFMQYESDVNTFDRFQREEEIAQQLDHPYLLKIFPVGKARSRPYLVMEYLAGRSLDHIMEACRPLPEPDAAKIASRICEALEHMHQRGIVHRDLKPQNIMVCNDGTIRILDFGIAKASRMRRLTFVGFSPTMGTPDYMAPEQVNGRRGDHRTDIYSLGAILYEMTTGKVPFEGESPYVIMNLRTTGDPPAPRKLNDRLTPVIEEITLHALARNPDERYASAAEMKAELDDYEKVQLVGRYQHLQAPRPWKGRFRLLPFILLFVAAQVALFGLMFWYFSTHGKH